MLSRSEISALAAAVAARPVARTLRADNTSGPPIALDDAVASGAAFFVVPRPGILAVDLDLPADPAVATGRRRAFDRLLEAAARAGVACVVTASGRSGNRHLFLPVPCGADRDSVAAWCRDHGLDVRDRGIRPPGAPHRCTGRSELVEPAGPAAACAVLRAAPPPGAARLLARALSPIRLPARVRLALRAGHEAAGYESPSNARMGLAVAVRGRGGPIALLETLLMDASSPLGATFRARPARWQRQELARLWDKAGRWIGRPGPAAAVARHLSTVAGALRSAVWRGLSGGTDLAVAEALVAVARRAGTATPGCATADIACEAGVSEDTARRSLRRLVKAGWLSVAQAETATLARTYRLSIPPGVRPDLAGDTPGTALDDLGGDVARWRALGKLSVHAWRTLRARGPQITSGLAAMLGWSAPATRRHLRKLAAVGIVSVVHGRWMAADDAAPASLAADLGTFGARRAQRRAVAARRELRRQARLCHLPAPRGWPHPGAAPPDGAV